MATYNLKQLWTKACEHDGIEPSSTFVVFSKANPWAKEIQQSCLPHLAAPAAELTHCEEDNHA